MHPELFHLGSITIYSYGVLMALGFFAAWALSVYRLKAAGLHLSKEDMSNLLIGCAVSGLLGGRLFYLLQFWNEFSSVQEMILSRSGFVWYGGVISGMMFLFVFSSLKKVSLPKLLDLIVPGASLGYGLGRVGCFLYGCCYGKISSVPWAVNFPDFPGELRHPTQLYSALGAWFIVLILLLLDRKPRPAGQLFLWGLFLHSLFRFAEEFLRENPLYGFLSAAQWISLAMMLVCVVLYFKENRMMHG